MNAKRLYQHIHELGKIGKDDAGGVTRLPYTKEDEMAKDYLIRLMKHANLTIHIDAIGNIIGSRKGLKDTKILCGSHFDTVKNGGNFDGCLGILAAIEVLQTFDEKNIHLKDTVEVIAFKDEEGNRFHTGMIGSRAICGTLMQSHLDAVDKDGISVQLAARSLGYPIEQYQSCAYDFSKVKAYLELHIEQGSVLEANSYSVGIVKGIAGLKRYMLSIHGKSGHAGAIPMGNRVDPVIAFSKISIFMNEQIKKYMDAVVTIGEIHTYPGACNVICDHITCSIDIRSLSMPDINSFMKEVTSFLMLLNMEGFTYHLSETQAISSAICDTNIQEIMKMHMEQSFSSSFSLISGAGHDAMSFYEKCPIGMLFVRSKNGFSHRPEEFSSYDDCKDGLEILYKTLVSISNRK